MCLHRAVSTHPQARASFLSIHPTIPARFLVATCPLPSPQDPSCPVRAIYWTLCSRAIRTLAMRPWRGVGPPQWCRPETTYPNCATATPRDRRGITSLACWPPSLQVHIRAGGAKAATLR